MINLVDAVLIAAVAALVFVHILYLYSLLKKDASIIDPAWGLGFIVIACSLILVSDGGLELNEFMILRVAVFLWGIRLFIHVLTRNIGTGEDWRYSKLREQWGSNFAIRSYLQLYIFQALLMVLVALPILVASTNIGGQFSWRLNIVLGIGLWALGFVFESVGDYQLRQFIAKKKHALESARTKKQKNKVPKIMQSGLWKYTRHPNYFGEMAQWFGLFLVVLHLDYGLLAMVSPITITYVLVGVSGIAMVEKKYKDDAEFQEYKKRTSAIIPWLPR